MFKVGDEVSWNGLLGKIEMFTDTIGVKFTNGLIRFFTPDGKYDAAMTEACLKLVYRPKNKVKYYPALMLMWGRVEITAAAFDCLEDAENFCNFEFDKENVKLLAWPYIPGVTEIEEQE